jgi:hypothetical protein
MKYYYLDGIEKKGPYTLAELRSRNLSSDTMVYREGRQNWSRLSDFEEVKITPKLNVSKPFNDRKVNTTKPTPSIENKIKLPKHTIQILFIVVSIGVAALITSFQQKNEYKKINEELNTLFKGKTIIAEYFIDSELYGQLYDVVYHAADTKDPIFKDDNFVTVNDKRIASEPYRDASKTDNYWYNKELQQWEMFRNLKQYYIKGVYIFDGFSASKLSRNQNIITITNYYGGDMAYKVHEKKHIKGAKYTYFSTPGYDTPTYRPSIKKCFEEAAKFVTKDDKDSNDNGNLSSKILDFKLGAYNNNFYEMKQTGDKYYYLGDTIHIIKSNGENSYVIDNDKITSSTSRYDAYVSSSQWIVWYKSYNNTYALEPKKWAFLIYFSIYSTIGIILSIIIYFIIKNRKRIVIDK